MNEPESIYGSLGCLEIPKYLKVVSFWPFSHYFSLSEQKKLKKKQDWTMNKVASFDFKFSKESPPKYKIQENWISWFFHFTLQNE